MTDFDRFGNSYENELDSVVRFSGQDSGFFTRVKAQRLLELVRRHAGDPAQLNALDIGCGIGLTDSDLVGNFRSLAGVDISSVAIERAAARNPGVEYTAYDGGRLPYPDQSVDVAFTICVLHHVPPSSRPAFMAEMRRVVREGGIAVIGEHNPVNPLTRIVVSRCAFDEDVRLLHPREAETLFRMSFLEPVERRYILIAPFDNGLAQRVERGLSRLPVGAQYLLAAKRAVQH